MRFSVHTGDELNKSSSGPNKLQSDRHAMGQHAYHFQQSSAVECGGINFGHPSNRDRVGRISDADAPSNTLGDSPAASDRVFLMGGRYRGRLEKRAIRCQEISDRFKKGSIGEIVPPVCRSLRGHSWLASLRRWLCSRSQMATQHPIARTTL